jgi:NAD-dependent deacetylase
MPQPVQRAIDLLRSSAYTVALTGAGISTPSGIPDFRGERNGLWRHADPLEIASIWAFHDHPERFYEWLRPLLRKTLVAQPNPAHRGLAEMEDRGALKAVITQNIDSLHQRAGSRRVLELHGHLRSVTCLNCGTTGPSGPLLAQVAAGALPPLCAGCGGLLKPDVVLFGEPLPSQAISEAQQEALSCELMLVVGTSLEVMPAADLPLLAKRRGARLVLINLTPTPLDDRADVVLRADVVTALRVLSRAVQHSPI